MSVLTPRERMFITSYIRVNSDSDDIRAYGIGNGYSHPGLYFTELSPDRLSNPFANVFNANGDIPTNLDVNIGLVNTNSDGLPNTEHVHALRIADEGSNTDTNMLGQAPLYQPAQYSYISIYTDSIRSFQRKFRPRRSYRQVMNHVLGHEIGHTVNLVSLFR